MFYIRISKYFIKSKKLYKLSTILFIINPATIFMTSMYFTILNISYSESLFYFFLLNGLYFQFCKIDNSINAIISSIFYSLCLGTRSNGLILLGFVIFPIIKNIKVKFLKVKFIINNRIILY
jgi:Gpi18-like mannosyltransferase